MESLSIERRLTLIVEKVPLTTPANAIIYVTGNFNGWYPDVLEFALQKQHKHWEITITTTEQKVEFKFTRGTWERAEADGNGNRMFNRKFDFGSSTEATLKLSIENWEDKQQTMSRNVHLLDDAFYIPQLDRHRRIWIYLPPGYEKSEKRYPVLYMHDGQNLFDSSLSNSGEWAVDKTLNQLSKRGQTEVIVVGIENGGTYRGTEYVPWKHHYYAGGDADGYCAFIVDTLKPFVDNNYRTLTDRDNTGIMGSSFGGIISFYIGFKYPHVFSKLGVFSPSFWISESAFEMVEYYQKYFSTKIYMLAGIQEGSILVENCRKMLHYLRVSGFLEKDVHLEIKADGQHHEWFWKREFAAAFLWLFGNETK